MHYIQLGSSDVIVPPMFLGGMSFGGSDLNHRTWTLNQQDTRDVIKTALDLGIDAIDTANCYSAGASEEYIGNSLHELGVARDSVILASKVYVNKGHSSAEAIRHEIEGSLRRLQTDYLDLYILHRFDYETPIEETMQALDKLVHEGKVRALGASEMYGYQYHSLQLAAERNGWTPLSSLQCHYNLLYREDERELIPVSHQYGALTTPYSPLASGHLARREWDSNSSRALTDTIARDKYYGSRDADQPIVDRVWELAHQRGVSMVQIALAWHWAHGPSAPVVGMTSPHRVEEAVKALDVHLENEEVSYLEELYKAHELVGPLARPGEKRIAGNAPSKGDE